MKPLAEQNFYEILEVRQDAAAPEIESAYARARELYGPGSLATYSLVAPEEAALLAARIEEAKRILLDPESRARYDAGLAAVAEAAETAVRIAATGSGAVAAGPQRPWLVPPAMTPRPPPPPPAPEPAKVEPPAQPKVEAEEAAKEAPAALETKEEGPKAEEAKPVAAVDGAEPVIEPKAEIAEAPVEAVVAAPAPVAPVPPEPPSAPPPGPILLKKEVSAEPQRAFPVPDGAVWSGEALRKVRESRGLSVRELCERTKITRYHLENIEGDRFSLLPAAVYLRGILVAVARELRLDGQKVARSYLERMSAADPRAR